VQAIQTALRRGRPEGARRGGF